MPKINYPKWFYDQYKYLSIKDTHIDTKWVGFVDRYKKLIDMSSSLMEQQPFGVVGNNYGFDQLLQLMTKSNYSFDDLNSSLIDTYNRSLKNMIGKMTVNTGAVIFHTRNTDMRNVSGDKSGQYFVIDAPFNQMHFGERDEFIRQRLHDMHITETDQYIPMDRFISSEISDILGFTLLCTTNGYICNDWLVAIDDKGFKFKVKWGYASDVDFIVYKLDDCFTFQMTVDFNMIKSLRIPMSMLPPDIITKHGNKGNYKCIVNIYDNAFRSSVLTVPNFATLNNNGLVFTNIQNKTINTLQEKNSRDITITVYALKNFHEVPNLYPGINYYELIDSERVYTDKRDVVSDLNEKIITASELHYENKLEVCTPPISLDRSSNVTFDTIMKCLQIKQNLNVLKGNMNKIADGLKKTPKTADIVISDILPNIQKVLPSLKSLYTTYVKGCLLTSLVPDATVKRFDNLIINLEKTEAYILRLVERYEQQLRVDWNTITKYDLADVYAYQSFIDAMYKPFSDEKLSVISNMRTLVANFYPDEINNAKRFNRPVSEYCFIVLKYDFDNECWVFDYPEIKRFHGIGNTFYIDSKLRGNEVFKFFVLYTDTDNPSETYVEPMDIEHVIDFDLFAQEVSKHIGYVRYWYSENIILKLSELMYNKYDTDTQIQLLSKILKRKTDSHGLLWDDISDIEYETSAMESFDYKSYDENSEYAPFALNFLFYTLSMLSGNEDKLESFFVSSLVDKKYNNRYSDIDISDYVKSNPMFPVNLSSFCKAPTSIDINISVLSDKGYEVLYYGCPCVFCCCCCVAKSCPTLCDPMDCSTPDCLSLSP